MSVPDPNIDGFRILVTDSPASSATAGLFMTLLPIERALKILLTVSLEAHDHSIIFNLSNSYRIYFYIPQELQLPTAPKLLCYFFSGAGTTVGHLQFTANFSQSLTVAQHTLQVM